MDAILYVDRTGIPWRYLPHDFPPHQTVYSYFTKWEADGIFDQLTGLLRRLVREDEGREARPSACLLDSQTVKTSANVHLADQGFDPAKRITGHKRHVVTDALGLLLAVLVTSAAVHNSTAAPTSWTTSPPTTPASPKPGPTPATRTPSSNTPPPAASTSKSSTAPQEATPSPSSPAVGSSNAPSAGSCTTAASPATTKRTRTDQPP